MSSAGWSEASETDRIMFTVLSNTQRIDLSKLPRLQHGLSAAAEDVTPRVEELPTILEEARSPVRTEMPPFQPLRYDDPLPPLPPLPPLSPPRQEPQPPRFEDVPPPPRPLDESLPPPPPASLEGEKEREKEKPSAPLREVNLEEEEMAKRSVLLDLQQLEMQGVRLTKQWTMEDRVEDMTLELRRHVLAMDEKNNVNTMKNGLKLFFTGIEMVNTRLGLLDLEGWSSQACSELSKHDANLSRIYRKYWRRSTSTSPEADIALSILGSMGYFHMRRSMAKQVMSRAGGRGGGGGSGSVGRGGRPRRPDTPSSDEEEPPGR